MIIEMIKPIRPGVVMVMGIVSAEVMKTGDTVTVFSDYPEAIPCRITGIEIYAPDQSGAFGMIEVEEVRKDKPAGLILTGADVDNIGIGDRLEI